MTNFSIRLHLSSGAERARATELAASRGLSVAEASFDAALLDASVASAWYWPEAREALSRIEASLALTLSPALTEQAGTDPRFVALELTKRAAEVVRELEPLAVEFAPIGLFHSKAAFVDQCEDAAIDDPPIYVWVRFVGTEAEGKRGMLTEGLALFGLLEVEVEPGTRDGEFILETVTDLAAFTLIERAAVDDGEQVELTHGKFRVRIQPSLRNDGTKAQRLRLGER